MSELSEGFIIARKNCKFVCTYKGYGEAHWRWRKSYIISGELYISRLRGTLNLEIGAKLDVHRLYNSYNADVVTQ